MRVRSFGSATVVIRPFAADAEGVFLTESECLLVAAESSEHRRKELIAGRLAVAEAFRSAGVQPRPSANADKSGRPVLDPDGGWFVSIAHDAEHVAAVIDDGAVGIDIVAIGRLDQATRVVEERVRRGEAVGLGRGERKWPDALLLWTAWEALGKRSGGGVLAGPMRQQIELESEDTGRSGESALRWWQHGDLLACLATSLLKGDG